MESIVAKRTKSIISERGLKQCAVALRAGYPPKIFNAMLNERRSIKDFDIANIATALNVSPNELLGYVERVPQKFTTN